MDNDKLVRYYMRSLVSSSASLTDLKPTKLWVLVHGEDLKLIADWCPRRDWQPTKALRRAQGVILHQEGKGIVAKKLETDQVEEEGIWVLSKHSPAGWKS